MGVRCDRQIARTRIVRVSVDGPAVGRGVHGANDDLGIAVAVVVDVVDVVHVVLDLIGSGKQGES